MTRLSDVARPGLMISQTWPTSREQRGATLAAIESALQEGFFEAFQTVEIPHSDERRPVAALLAGENKPLTYCLTRVLNENRLNLSDLDETNRRLSYERMIRALDDAREAGASAVAVVSGPKPLAPQDRGEALHRLADSLAHLCRAAAAAPAPRVLIEPLDLDADKRLTLGTTREALFLCKAVAGQGQRLWLIIDMAHALLNREDPAEALVSARSDTAEYHYCNPVLEVGHPLYGDKHLRFGPPGAVDIPEIARIMRISIRIGFLNANDRPAVFCEVLRAGTEDPIALMRYCRQVMLDAWEQANAGSV